MANNVRVLIGDLRTGRRIVDVPYTSCTWDNTLNEIGNIQVTVPLFDRRARRLGLRAAASPAKSFIAVQTNGRFNQGGPIWTHSYDEDAGTLQISGAGILSYFNRRTVLPPSTASGTPILNGDGSANVDANTSYSGISYGTMIKRLLQQATSFSGGSVPLLYPNDVAGTDVSTYTGGDLKLVGEAITDLSALDNGPDFVLDPFLASDGQGVIWQLRTGTPSQPRLFSNALAKWDNSVARRSMRKLTVDIDGQGISSTAWTTGGRTGDIAILSQQRNAALLAAGYPILETKDTSHTTATTLSTLDKYGKETLRNSQKPTEYWSFEVRADRSPYVGEYAVGDYCQITIGANNPYIPKGQYQRRILGLSGDGTGKWVKVTTGEVLSSVG